MKEVFFYDTGGYYLIGKVRKDYKIGDTLKLKKMRCKLIIIDINNKFSNSIIVKKAI